MVFLWIVDGEKCCDYSDPYCANPAPIMVTPSPSARRMGTTHRPGLVAVMMLACIFFLMGCTDPTDKQNYSIDYQEFIFILVAIGIRYD